MREPQISTSIFGHFIQKNVTIHCRPARHQRTRQASPKSEVMGFRTGFLPGLSFDTFYSSDRKRDKAKVISKFRCTRRPAKKHYLVCGKALTRVKIPSSAFAKSITCFLSASAAGRRKGLAAANIRRRGRCSVG